MHNHLVEPGVEGWKVTSQWGKILGRLEKNTWIANKFEKFLGNLKFIFGNPHDEVDLAILQNSPIHGQLNYFAYFVEVFEILKLMLSIIPKLT